MDEKTAELRDLFVDVTDEESVTESQTEQRGSLADEGDEEGVAEVVREMRDRFGFETDLDDERLRRIVELFYEGDDDEEIAAELDLSPEAVFEARVDLQLLRDEDAAGVDLSALGERLDGASGDGNGGDGGEDDGMDLDAVAADLEMDRGDLQSAIRVLRARDRARRTSYRFQTAFEERLTDADLSARMAADAREDGLEDATEDAEVDVDF